MMLATPYILWIGGKKSKNPGDFARADGPRKVSI